MSATLNSFCHAPLTHWYEGGLHCPAPQVKVAVVPELTGKVVVAETPAGGVVHAHSVHEPVVVQDGPNLHVAVTVPQYPSAQEMLTWLETATVLLLLTAVYATELAGPVGLLEQGTGETLDTCPGKIQFCPEHVAVRVVG
jgi:hypothetical protein